MASAIQWLDSPSFLGHSFGYFGLVSGPQVQASNTGGPTLAIAGAGSADSEEGDSSPNTGVSSVSRASSGGQEPAAALGKGRPIRPSDLRSRHGRLHPQH